MKKIVGLIFDFLNIVVPKKKNRIIFYCSFGYDDSARAFYEYLTEHKYDLDYVWAFDKNKFTKITGAKCVKNKSFKCFWYYLRSKYIFETHSFFGKRYNKNRQRFIFSLHGMPFKGMSKNDKPEKPFSKNAISLSTSEIFNVEVERFSNVSVKNTFPIGLPRNDFLFKTDGVLKQLKINQYSKVVIWMPTFRKTEQMGQDGRNSEFGIPCIHQSDLPNINKALVQTNTLLILKLHPWALDKMCDLSQYSNIISLKNENLSNLNIYQLVGSCDALITDYSSVFIDYLLIDKPICFAFDDLDDYQKTRELTFKNFKDYMCGPIVNDKAGLIRFVNDLAQNFDPFKEKRTQIQHEFHKYTDNQSCERLSKLVF